MAETPTKAPEAAKPEAPAAPRRFTARLRYARIAPRKMRYVVDLIRGKDYNSAVAILRTCSKRGAPFCKKLIESAFGNAVDIARNRNMDIDGEKLHLVEARVDPGPTIKRWRPSSVRRPQQIKKRTCHVTFVLEEREPKVSKKERSKRQKQERQKQTAARKAADQATKDAVKKAEGAPAKAPEPPPKAEARKPEPPKKEDKK